MNHWTWCDLLLTPFFASSCAVSLEEKITESCIYSIDICNPRRVILMCLRRFIIVDFVARWTNDEQFGHSDQIRVIEVPPIGTQCKLF